MFAIMIVKILATIIINLFYASRRVDQLNEYVIVLTNDYHYNNKNILLIRRTKTEETKIKQQNYSSYNQ